MPLFKVNIETTHVFRGHIVVEASDAIAAVAYANANHEWEESDGAPEDESFAPTVEAKFAIPILGERDLPEGWIPQLLPWNGATEKTIAELLADRSSQKTP